MSLSSLYAELHYHAARSGNDRSLELKGGARLGVRVIGDVTTLTISRKGKALGATEIEVFKRDCGVPSTAIRFPQEGQRTIERDGVTWHAITFRWREGEQPDG
jgi:hypothetical protein